MQNSLEIKLKLSGESAFLIQGIMAQTGKDFPEVVRDMLDIYKQVYFNREQELAWIKGDTVVKKLNTAKLWRRNDPITSD